MSATERSPTLRRRSEDSLETFGLIRRWQQRGDAEAREELCRQFMPLAHRLAQRYRSPHEPMEDLFQVASVGLLLAVDRFCPDRGSTFVAFAIPTILGELRRYFRDTGWSAHVPRRVQELSFQVDQATKQLSAETGRTPTAQAIAEHLKLSHEDTVAGLTARHAHYSVSAHAPLASNDGEGILLLDTLGRCDDGFDLVEARLWLTAEIQRLPYLERRAFTLRMRRDMTQKEIGRELGCSQMQVSRLLCLAAAHLRAQADPAPRGTAPR